jgi:hypothetical protein
VAALVAGVLAVELGWDERERATQLDGWRAEACAEGVVGNA